MICIELDSDQRAAIDASFDRCVAILGTAGTGKTTALWARQERAGALMPDAQPLIATRCDDLVDFAWSMLRADGFRGSAIDDVDARALFAEAAQPFVALEWSEFLDASLDPEIPGARTPQRFLASAFTLIQKLRDAAIAPDEFLRRSLAGATAFYAKPPNFAHPQLLSDTKETYRNSLDVTPSELQRQYRREIDLAKALAKLYRDYRELSREREQFPQRDALIFAAERLLADPQYATSLRESIGFACIDNAQDLRASDLAFLRALFGSTLAGVTLAGDPESATHAFRGARPEAVFAAAKEHVTLRQQYRSPLAIDLACRQLSGSFEKLAPGSIEVTLTLHRAKTFQREVAFVTDAVAAHLAAGSRPCDVALIFRSVDDVDAYSQALLDRNIAVQIVGDYNIFNDRYALDAIALLWNVWNPFAHDWLLRTLANPLLALSDASIATLCSEPPDAQTSLFITQDAEPALARARRWDPKRDVRLGWNLIRGDCDGALNEVARARVVRFRALRETWIRDLDELPFATFLQRVWSGALARDGAPDSARAHAQSLSLQNLAARLTAFARERPQAALGDILAYAQGRSESAFEAYDSPPDARCVQIRSVDAARGLEFAHVILPDGCAGSFPRWYVPDAFLYSPKFGMIAKENVGDGRAARTAKFSYYMHHAKTRDLYNAQERRAFIDALRRAKRTALVTASGRATRGITAPEFLEELRAANLPGTTVTIE